MSKLVFDRHAHTLTLFDRQGNQPGKSWLAGNNVDSGHRLPGQVGLPAGVYVFKFDAHQRHGKKKGDTSSGSFGPMGIFALEDFSYQGTTHSGVGIHSGRKNKADGLKRSGPEHATHLCVRTTDEAMSMIHLTSMQDPLETLTVQDGATTLQSRTFIVPRILKTQA